MAIKYLRVKKTFKVTAAKFTGTKDKEISEMITTHLDAYGSSGWDLVDYVELFRDENIFDITTVFKMEV